MHIVNLRWALELCKQWRDELSVSTKENDDLIAFMRSEIALARKQHGKHQLYQMKFHERFLQIVSHSKVFMSGLMLPRQPFHPDETKLVEYIPAED